MPYQTPYVNIDGIKAFHKTLKNIKHNTDETIKFIQNRNKSDHS